MFNDEPARNGEYKLGVEGRLTALEVQVEELITNHIVHLEAKLDKLFWLVLTSLIAALLNLVSKFS